MRYCDMFTSLVEECKLVGPLLLRFPTLFLATGVILPFNLPTVPSNWCSGVAVGHNIANGPIVYEALT